MGRWAWAYSQVGQHADAHPLNVQVAKTLEQKLGPDDPQTLEAKADLALSYVQMGDLESGKKLAGEVFGRQLLVSSYSTRQWINNLCTVLINVGDFDEAAKLGIQALSEFEKVVGPNHHDTIVATSNLALVYNGQRKHEEAARLAQKAVEKSSVQLGQDHPVSLVSTFNLALIKFELGEQEGALDYKG
ncbi:hypothetical protein M0657_011900 [Pyricularia oryzae]|nr:hypothetical protein M0657_011900 [Pyricularia oryzae]